MISQKQKTLKINRLTVFLYPFKEGSSGWQGEFAAPLIPVNAVLFFISFPPGNRMGNFENDLNN